MCVARIDVLRPAVGTLRSDVGLYAKEPSRYRHVLAGRLCQGELERLSPQARKGTTSSHTTCAKLRVLIWATRFQRPSSLHVAESAEHHSVDQFARLLL